MDFDIPLVSSGIHIKHCQGSCLSESRVKLAQFAGVTVGPRQFPVPRASMVLFADVRGVRKVSRPFQRSFLCSRHGHIELLIFLEPRLLASKP